MGARALGACSAALFACHSTNALEVLAPTIQARSAILAIEAPGGDPLLYALEVEDGARPVPPPFSVRSPAKLTFLYSIRTLEELFLRPGPIPLAAPAAPPDPKDATALPRFDEAFRAEISERTLSPWTRLAGPLTRADLAPFRLPSPTFAECAKKGGCFAAAADETEPECLPACAPSTPIAPAAAQLPDKPRWSPCPAGWSPADVGGSASACVPPERVPSACGAGEAQWVDAPTCARVGTACPSGDWAENPWSGPVLYVRRSAPPGGDGSKSAPFQSLAAALQHAAPGTTIALAKETHDLLAGFDFGPVPVRLLGACTRDTVLRFRGLFSQGALGAIKNLTIDTAASLTAGPTPSSHLDLEDVILSGSAPSLINVSGAGTLLASWVAFRGGAQHALAADTGGVIEIHRADFGPSPSVSAIFVTGRGSKLTGSDLSISTPSPGIRVSDGALADVERALFFKSWIHGLVVYGEGSSARMTDVVIRDVVKAQYPNDSGIRLYQGGALTLSRALIERTNYWGILAQGGPVSLTDVIIGDDRTSAPPTLEVGVWTSAGSTRLERVAISGALWRGIWVSQQGSVELRSVAIKNVYNDSMPRPVNAGIQVEDTGRIFGSPLSIDHIRDEGLHLEGDPIASLQDVSLAEVSEGPGLRLVKSASAEVERIRVENIHGPAIELFEHARLKLDDARIGPVSIGIALNAQSELTLTRADVSEARYVGICVNEMSKLSARDLLVHDTKGLAAACSFAAPSRGVGVLVDAPARLIVSRFRVDKSYGSGMTAVGADSIDAEDGKLSNNAIGFRALRTYRVDRYLRRVAFADNTADLDLVETMSP